MVSQGVGSLPNIRRLLEDAVALGPNAPAVLAPGRTPLTYGRLLAHVDHTIQTLNILGLGHNDRIGIVVPDGPELAVAFLAVAAGATCVPLNPAWRSSEFDRYLSDLKVKAVVVQSGIDSAAASAARARGISVIELRPTLFAGAGIFTLCGDEIRDVPRVGGFADGDDIALVLPTSGTTSRPKVVPLTQSNICVSADNIARTLRLTRDDCCLNVMPLFHIHGLVGAVLSSLAAGSRVVCTPGFSTTGFFDWMDETSPSWYTAVPTLHQKILARAPQQGDVIARSRLRFIRSCSAPLPPAVMAELERVFGVPVIEAYGMTEASHQVTSNPLPPGERKAGSVGIADGVDVAIVNDRGERLPLGAIGEIMVRGASVTRGYEGDLSGDGAAVREGWFRTGDQGCMDADGYLFMTGRTKEIINRGGEKISPREIDDVLAAHPSVAHAMAFAVPDDTLGEDVGVAVVIREGTTMREADVREFVALRLADFKIPRRVVFVQEIPLGPTGKPMRIGLAQRLSLAPAGARKAESVRVPVRPRTPTEMQVAEMWRELLKIETVGVHDDFFALGGDSLLAAQLIARIRQPMDASLSMAGLFEMATVAQLAAWLDSQRRGPSGGEIVPLSTTPHRGEAPLSSSQERMWFLEQYRPNSHLYVKSFVYRIGGRLDIGTLERSLRTIVQRHEVLRTTYHSRAGIPGQVISPDATLSVSRVDVSEQPESERMSRALEIAGAEAQRRFDLSNDLMLRATVVRLRDDEHVFVLTLHHIACDGWSISVLLQELTTLYTAYSEGATPQLPDLRIQYADFAAWQRTCRDATDPLYWKLELGGVRPAFDLPTDHPRPTVLTDRGARQQWLLPSTLTEGLKTFSRQERGTLFMVLLAGFSALLSRYTREETVLVGTPVAGRSAVETERLVGLFVNTVVLRTDLSDDPSFRELVSRVRQVTLGALDHQHLPFDKLVEILQPERALSHSPLVQVMFQLRNHPTARLDLRGATVEQIDLDAGTVEGDLVLEVVEQRDRLACVINYNTDLFEADTILQMLRHYETLLEAAIAAPTSQVSTLSMVTPRERRELLDEWNDTRAAYPHACVHEIFEGEAKRNPNAVAVIFEGNQISYGELDRRASHLAECLRGLGVGPETPVGICVERSIEMIVGLLGVLKAGGAYVPLEPAHPIERRRFIAEDTGLRILLTQHRLAQRPQISVEHIVPLDRESEWPAPTAPGGGRDWPTPHGVACVLYTSGSTGNPKGVEITHRGIARLAFGVPHARLGSSEVVLQISPLGFDASTFEIWGALLHGGRLVLYPGSVPTPSDLGALLSKHKVSIALLTSALFNVVIDEMPEALSGVERLFTGGEALSVAHVRRALARLPNTRLINAYGPTECTTIATCYAIPGDLPDDAASIPIGRPIANTSVYILDRNRQPVPVGVPGEICLGGDGLARGYVEQPELTARAFIPSPFAKAPGERLYATGDLARYRPDGNLEFLGRFDDQVKIRGFRIEPQEIEDVLGRHPDVRESVVVVHEDGILGKRLAAFVILEPTGTAGPPELRDFLKQRLPDYMVPAGCVMLPALPLTPNGKVDRSALAASVARGREAEPTYVAPRIALEHDIVRIWEDLLGVTPIGRTDDFFRLGGHSLLAVRMVARIETTCGVKIPIATVFGGATVEHLAQAVFQAQSEEVQSSIVPIRSEGTLPPFFFLHAQYPGGGFFCRDLAAAMDIERPFYTILPHGLDGKFIPPTIQDMAADRLQALLDVQPTGPYLLGGYCNGGLVALEMARRLETMGRRVDLLVIVEAQAWNSRFRDLWHMVRGLGFVLRLDHHRQTEWFARLRELAISVENLASSAHPVRRLWQELRTGVRAVLERTRTSRKPGGVRNTPSPGPHDIYRRAVDAYVPEPYRGRVALFRTCAMESKFPGDPTAGWDQVTDHLEIHTIAGDHMTCLTEHVEDLAKSLAVCLNPHP